MNKAKNEKTSKQLHLLNPNYYQILTAQKLLRA
jgi:hypothetical protein